MKKILLFILLFVSAGSAVFAQKDAIGLRGGYGVEISYQKYVSNSNRWEFDLGLPPSFNLGFNAAATYQWVKPLPTLPQGFNWYWGVGGQVGYYGDSDSVMGEKYSYSYFSFGVAGQIGIEYNFPSIPLNLSIDWRPGIGLTTTSTKTPFEKSSSVGFNNGGLWGFAGAIRYCF